MKQNGFTLIELVVIIVILGILAVTAAPRFLNNQTEAKNAALQGLKAAIESGVSIGYGKMAIAGLESLRYVSNTTPDEKTPAQSLPIPGCELNTKHCAFMYGYPDADFSTLPKLVENIGNDQDWDMLRTGNDENDRAIKITFNSNIKGSGESKALIEERCYLRYVAAVKTKNYQLTIAPCE